MSDETLLVDTEGLQIRVTEDKPPKLEFSSDPDLYDLSVEDDVVVVVDGEAVEVESKGPGEAVAQLPDIDEGSSVMIRVHEFFEGWELK